MMAQYNIEMKELDVRTEKDVVEHNRMDGTNSKWKQNLAIILADNFRCELLIRRHRGSSARYITFLGFEEDVEIANAAYEFAMKVMDKGMNKCYDYYYDNGLPSKGVKLDYCNGFLAGLKAKFQEQLKSNQEWGLVLVTPIEVVNKLESMKLKTINIGRAKGANNAQAQAQGYKDGKNFGFGKQLADGTVGGEN